MSVSELRNVVLLFSNPVWGGANTVPSTIVRNITRSSSQIAYEERISSNITTLTMTNAATRNGVIQGLLYVPDIVGDEACDRQQYDFLPKNVTRRANLPPTNYNLIAIAPWFSIDCTLAYLANARLDPIRAFIFYKPNNSTNQPQDVDSPVWNLEDNGKWKTHNKYPIFAVPGLEGQKMTQQLSHYSGSIESIPHGAEINQLYGPNPKDYVRIWTELSIKEPSNIPTLWSWFLIIIGALLLIVGLVSITMHLIQRGRRKSLKRRVETGEVDLEAMGIKRLTVPPSHVKEFPLFTYNSEPDTLAAPATPLSPGGGSLRPSRNHRRHDQRSIISSNSMRSKRSSICGSVDTTATNFQPHCHICLVKFDHRITIIRELSCGHIFHPECIDEFLLKNSSLCPMCKQCMLPRGYSPRITNGMVRRERAVRRLRERVDIDGSSLESGEAKIKGWGKRFFRPSSSTMPVETREVPMTPVNNNTPKTIRDAPSGRDSATEESTAATNNNAQDQNAISQPPPPASRPSKSKRTKPRALKLLPTQPEDSELRISPPAGRKSPSSFARQRMREIANRNAPFDDPDGQRAKWRLALRKVFPGYS